MPPASNSDNWGNIADRELKLQRQVRRQRSTGLGIGIEFSSRDGPILGSARTSPINIANQLRQSTSPVEQRQMGAYYYYVNETRRQFFCIDPAKIDVKSYALGRNIGSRALSYLLIRDFPAGTMDAEDDPMVGSWIGDRISVITDDYSPNWKQVSETYEDVGQQVIEMIVRASPGDLVEYGGVEWLCWTLQHNGEAITFSHAMKKRLSKFFRLSHREHPSDDLARIIDVMRNMPMPISGGDS